MCWKESVSCSHYVSRQAEMSASNCIGCTASVLRLTRIKVPLLENLGRLISSTFCPSGPGAKHTVLVSALCEDCRLHARLRARQTRLHGSLRSPWQPCRMAEAVNSIDLRQDICMHQCNKQHYLFDAGPVHVLIHMQRCMHTTVSHVPELPTCDHLAAVGRLIANKEDMWGRL